MKKLLLITTFIYFGIVSGADEFAEDPRLVYFGQVQEVAARLRKAATDAYGNEAKLTETPWFGVATKGGMLLEVGGTMGGGSHRASLITALGKVCLYRAGVKDGGAEFLRRVSGEINIGFDGADVSDIARGIGWMYGGGPIDPFCVVNLDGSPGRTGYGRFCFKRAPGGGEIMLSQEELVEKLTGRLVVPSCGDGEVTYSLDRYKGGEDFVELVRRKKINFDQLEPVWTDLARRYEEERSSLEEEKTDDRKDLAPLFDGIED